jgi:CRISPR-associated protein Csc3
LSGITRDLATDPLFLFSYLRKQQRAEQRDALRSDWLGAYLHIYKNVLEEDLSKIEQCVDRYTQFYRGGFESHSILKPVDIVARAIITSPLNIEADDLLWQIQGELKNWLDRVRNRQAAGRALLWGKDIDAKELPALRAFVQFFYKEIFLDYCEGERGILRSRLNRFKDGCEAYYVYQRSLNRIQEQTEQNTEVIEESLEI